MFGSYIERWFYHEIVKEEVVRIFNPMNAAKRAKNMKENCERCIKMTINNNIWPIIDTLI